MFKIKLILQVCTISWALGQGPGASGPGPWPSRTYKYLDTYEYVFKYIHKYKYIYMKPARGP